MKRRIWEMVQESIEDSERWRGGLGIGGAERSASEATPDSGYRRVDKARSAERKTYSRRKTFVKVVGFIPLLPGKVVDWFPYRKRILPHCGHHCQD